MSTDCEKPRKASPRLTARGLQRRHALIEAATRTFIEHGFEGATLDMIIDLAGGSRGTLYSSFGGKEGLFAAVIERMIEEIFVAPDPGSAAHDSLERVLEHYGRRFLHGLLAPRSIGLYRLIVAEAPRFPQIGEHFYTLGPERSYQLLAERLGQLHGIQADRQTLSLVACQFLEMLKADLFLKAVSMPAYTPASEDIEQRLQLSVKIIAHYLQATP
ncbi:TetR/AcrR family transcriptional regulator [Pseudomonas sp. B21-032]|uniref:TetR/AcrR family transcriptional regulator n=1 Tax=Pseudomonas sp. B21-032 TaxID=2895483 RepID=UPI00215E9C05|nr:TetR/AcrR family transcriptional regulator [Pseudomonas sp. B21-032]UVL62914.1 TetR/AcrR family transcriptional regulator [Pseudomonas sp. B21-032]